MKYFLSKQMLLTILVGCLMAGCQTTTEVSGDVTVDYRTVNKR